MSDAASTVIRFQRARTFARFADNRPFVCCNGRTMRWYFYLAYFLGGAFLVNAIPHFVNGVSGRSFPTPFASPPGKGQSSPMVNVLWGTLNAVVA
jgi:hypothetical protein